MTRAPTRRTRLLQLVIGNEAVPPAQAGGIAIADLGMGRQNLPIGVDEAALADGVGLLGRSLGRMRIWIFEIQDGLHDRAASGNVLSARGGDGAVGFAPALVMEPGVDADVGKRVESFVEVRLGGRNDANGVAVRAIDGLRAG